MGCPRAQKSAARAKKARFGSEVVVVDTPREISYKTSKDSVDSPYQTSGLPDVTEGIYSDTETEEAPDLRLRWNGRSRSDLIAVFNSAKRDDIHAEPETAKAKFLEALDGYEHILGATHEDTTKVVVALASFFTRQNRMADADEVMEKACRKHIAKLGIEHKRTQQLIMQFAELLNGCNREEDALAFLARAKESAKGNLDRGSALRRKDPRDHPRRDNSRRKSPAQESDLMSVTRQIQSDNDPAQIDHALVVARDHVTEKDQAVESLLKTIVDQCEGNPVILARRNLQARTELLKLYNNLGVSRQERAEFLRGMAALKHIIANTVWKKQRFESFEVMEASLELAASILKGGFEREAHESFVIIENKADDAFGWDEERTIWVKINIGIIYQTHKTWHLAKPWFEHAYVASSTANGYDDGITISLEQALDKRHFTYVSDEGRPFKTIFGVCGSTIRPNRLHIE
ncbi:uncharacterized protein BDZ99DRAFT_248117 [Mytilinidion resinicola]|uniref:TPR-like protein n=1 Tax=Mytilinidion resinicola TaxID=574789 RepID=A0A6A6YYF8_9PEZI|nr:uncharacterized protein BDZ99DRAFT_248117 [Mytilinidion resinicola]KAF2813034.1 hypothetical protein BDZ99DRAFT_248117 [Mytilinidion resinicola]